MSSISVIMPFRNAAQYLRAAIESVRAQTRPPDELILIDDASTDDSLDIAQVIDTPFKKVILRVAVRNAAAARNAALAVAEGEWVAFLDADDVWYEEHLDKAMQALEAGRDVAYRSFFDILSLDGTRTRLPSGGPLRSLASGLTLADFFRLHYLGLPNSSGTYVIRRDVASAVGGFDAALPRRHDIDFWIRAIHTRTWAFSPYVAMGYRTASAGSISKNIAERNRYELTVWLRAETLLPGDPWLQKQIRASAGRALRTALTEGTPRDIEIARQLALRRVSPLRAVQFEILRRVSWLVRATKQAKGLLGGRAPRTE